MSQSLKEAVKELYGVDTLTPQEFRSQADALGWTREMTYAHFTKGEHNPEEVEDLMKEIYPEIELEG